MSDANHSSTSFPAKLTYLHSILSWLAKHLQNTRFSQADRKKIELAIEEAVVNIIRHAYQDPGHEIAMIFRKLPGKIEIEIRDSGKPFNPLEHILPIDPNLSLEERKIGGIGLSLIENIMDELDYKRQDEINRLILGKRYESS